MVAAAGRGHRHPAYAPGLGGPRPPPERGQAAAAAPAAESAVAEGEAGTAATRDHAHGRSGEEPVALLEYQQRHPSRGPAQLCAPLEAELITHHVGRSDPPQGGGQVESAVGTLRRELWEV